ncbi:MAG: valine--tRNA ligase [Anaerolineae bacterium]|nr:valine--tRNA ligase [Anaerolineae bacterium]
MGFPKRYNPRTDEPALQAWWEEQGIYHFRRDHSGPVYAIDTPPATVSGHLHLGHAYSYTQTDFSARFWRMRGHNVFYPMGYDDNGLPTERYVERRTGQRVGAVGHEAYVQRCLEIGREGGTEYGALWRQLGLSADWRHTYRTIEPRAVRIAQTSFLQLYERGLIYRAKAPAIWCPECRTAIAQAELNDLDRESTFYTIAFPLDDGDYLPIATTRPELLPACVAIFVHPEDPRYRALLGRQATVPLFGQQVPILPDRGADPEKGTGAVMCCTFGDVTDVQWWRTHNLPLVEAIGPSGALTAAAGPYAGLHTAEGREQIVRALYARAHVLHAEPLTHSVRVHERCDTPVEYLMVEQWFTRVLDHRDALLAAGEQIRWHPPHMGARYRQWVEDLNWDWCLSRQRAFGVPFPVWHCTACGAIVLADPAQLPVDPTTSVPPRPCACGSRALAPETDVMDTWATSSLSPQIAGGWLDDPDLHRQVYPMALRPQAHDIIRTWTFYTIVKSLYHFGAPPWSDVAISGWGIAGEGMGKISKSRGGGPMSPQEMIDAYSADAVRYWAASTGLGKDAVISEQKIQLGHKLVTKLWNVARFGARFLTEGVPDRQQAWPATTAADRWILARAQEVIGVATERLSAYEHAAAKSVVEAFFWTELADNYVEMAKLRLYDRESAGHPGARFTLHYLLLVVLKLFAPFLPHVTERIYRELYATAEVPSLHTSPWPVPDPALEDASALEAGQALLQVATAVRRYKSEHGLSLASDLRRLALSTRDPALARALRQAQTDLQSVTRAREVAVLAERSPGLESVAAEGSVGVQLLR